MKNYLLLMTALPVMAFGQFKNDNVTYKTIYWEDFCKQIATEKNALVLDVRSPGEYNDTSQSTNLNIGRLKGAKHINVTELGNRIHEIDAYKNQPVYIYCSHSQRSRRSSRMLSDSGFTNVININGGLTALYLADEQTLPCRNKLVETSNAYQQLNPRQVYKYLQANPTVTIVDVRSDSAFKGLGASEKDKALGRMKNAVNIPLASISGSFNSIPKDKPVLVIDDYGDQAAKAAVILAANGYSNIMTNFNGLAEWLELPASDQAWANTLVERKISYELLDPGAFDALANQKKAVILDVRTADEFQNKAKEYWKNRGHIKDAINIPVAELNEKYTDITAGKDQPVIVYAFSSGAEAYNAAAFLNSKGFTKLYVLTSGIWGLRYRAYNFPGQTSLKDWVVDIPEANL